jgi:transposase
MHSLAASKIEEVLSLIDSGHSARQISSITGTHYSTVTRLWSKHHPDTPKPCGGHPAKLSDTDIHHAMHLINSGKADNAAQVTQILRNIKNTTLSTEAVRLRLKGAGWKAVVKKKRPMLSKHHKKERMDFAVSHKEWTLEDWKRVVWSDETKVNRLGSDGRKWVWKRVDEPLTDQLVQGTKKFGGGSIMVWGCMTWDGAGMACKIDGKMDAELYCQILDDDLQKTFSYYGKNPAHVLFQQDNDPKHTSKRAQNWFNNHGIQVMQWPSQSPDLNPIEHLWNHVKRKLGEYEEPATSVNELWERFQDEWDGIEPSVCQNLIESMPRRIEAVLRAKGGYTKY